jgi:sarcosine oxidase subunit beta
MRYDFVVMGGGVYGCATAWELARRGASVIVLEA